jgi:hypothetical protein
MTNFEYAIKRKFNPAVGLDGDERFVVHGLVKNDKLRFGNSTMLVSRSVKVGLLGCLYSMIIIGAANMD